MTSASSPLLRLPIRNIRRLKFGNKPTVIQGIRFASQKEAKRYLQLKMLESTGVVRDLELQIPFKCVVNGKYICTYVCDFRYQEYRKGAWLTVVSDAKGVRTPVYNLKKKLVFACLGVTIEEC